MVAKTTKQTNALTHLNARDAAEHTQHGTTHVINERKRVTDKKHEEEPTHDSI